VSFAGWSADEQHSPSSVAGNAAHLTMVVIFFLVAILLAAIFMAYSDALHMAANAVI
jgi:hypothetical protein